VGVAVVRGRARALFRDLPALEARLGSLDVPTVVVSGAADRVVTPSAARALTARIPGASLRLIRGAGHVLPHQHPEALSGVITELAQGGPDLRRSSR
jgi:pimeloyl-ACP methyl ester carboxylesterase